MNGRDRRSISAYLRKPSDPYQKGSSENGHVRQRCRTGIHPLRFAPTEKSCKTGMYASRVESRRLRATTAAAFQKSLPELRPPWQGPSSQVEGGRPWVQGPRYRLGYLVPANGEGSRIPHYVLFGHHGAMRGTVARSCLTFCRIRGMGRGKNVPPWIPPTEPRRLYSPRCRIHSLRTVPLELGIECRRKQIHVKGTERSENSGHDLGVEGPLRGGNAAAGQEVRNKLVLPGAVLGDRDNIPAPAPCPQLFRRVERVPPCLFM